ncbi:MAG: hypothetical protein GC203_04845 [Phenylobacterium sp.]|uniref:hypothetical protein n=1 Tax=Phenylobacterium sp. TaxID=1871053 RepID=UPI0025D89303|nr:hypothetical protein [Phenylobacterium sp.]MBI1197171.1 hypothetical protein [Phenylobacterium sp.]
MPHSTVRDRSGVRFPPELANIVGTSGAILAVVALGSGIVAVLPNPDTWQTAAAYLGPAGLAFAAYWWVAQKL